MNIILTGASRGIGYETTKLFAQNNQNNIFVISRNKAKLNQLATECNESFPGSIVYPLIFDLTQKETIDELVSQINNTVNHIDILINNAGYLVNKPFEQFSHEDLKQMFNVNVIAPTKLIQKTLPLLKNAKSAHIINISSMGGFQGSSKFPGLAPYSASKSAIAGLTECLAEEYKATNMKFNALALGAVATEMLEEAFPGYKAPISANEMAAFIYDFAINGNRFFNGKIIPVSSTTP